MDRTVRRSRLGIDHARPDTTTQPTDGLPVIPLTRELQVLPEWHFEIAIQSPAIDLVETLVALASTIAAESDGKWIMISRGAIDGYPPRKRRNAGCFSRSRVSSLKGWVFLGKRIEQS